MIFLYVNLNYDPTGRWGRTWSEFPEGVNVNTKGKFSVEVYDTRDVFSNKSGTALLDQFKKELEVIYSFVDLAVKDIDMDIMVKFHTKEEIPLGYFYQGQYHSWEK